MRKPTWTGIKFFLLRLISKKARLGLPACIVITVLAAAFITALMLKLQSLSWFTVARTDIENFGAALDPGQGNWREIFAYAVKVHGYTFLLNFIPVFLLLLTVFFLCANVVLSVGITGFVGIFMALVNQNKAVYRLEPFMPWDVMMGNEFFGVAGELGGAIYIKLGLYLLIYIAFFGLLLYFIRTKRIKPGIRVLTVELIIIVFYLANRKVLANPNYNGKIPIVGNQYNQVDVFNSKGFIYSFMYTLNNVKIEKPPDYSRKDVEREIGYYSDPDPGRYAGMEKPHIIIVMSEAFTELALHPAFDFGDFEDPLGNYRLIREESLTGHIIAPYYGGSTSDTEFDMLTGLNTRLLPGVSYSYALVKRDFNSLARVLDGIGYGNTAMHPGEPWFYNRNNVYGHFGFDGIVFKNDFEDAGMDEVKGSYITEKATFDWLIGDFGAHLGGKTNAPYFSFCVTIQNHGPYVYKDSGKGKYEVERNFGSETEFSAEGVTALSNYFEGLKDGDRELARLVEYLRGLDRPVVLLYFGDHLPSMPSSVDEQLIPYSESDFDNATRLYKTPFIIWRNEAAEGLIPFDGYRDGEVFGASYLGAYLLDILGFAEADPFFSFVNMLRVKYPLIEERRYFTADGTAHEYVPGENRDIDLYMKWGYYQIFN